MSIALGAGCKDHGSRPLNVVVITIDTLRADALGIYGNTGRHSPKIDAFAEEATVFDHATTPMGTTNPAHASLFTSLYPRRHGVRWNGDSLDGAVTALAEILRENAYETAAFVSFTSMLRRAGLHQGFVVKSDSPENTSEHFVRRGDDINSLARRWLDRRSENPFFVWLHYSEPHSPYSVTPYAERYFNESGYAGSLTNGLTVEEFLALGDAGDWAASEQSALRALYDGSVREADRLVGDIILELELRALLGETLVVLTADHGQALGEHGDVAHGSLLWQTVLQVPLVIRVPGLTAPPRIHERVGLTDVMPTILDLIGLPMPPDLDGRSLAPSLAGKPLAPRPYFAEVRAPSDPQDGDRARTDRFAAFDGGLKMVWDGGVLSLFDLDEDPSEGVHAMSDVSESRRRTLLQRLVEYRQSVEETKPQELPKETLDELRALGYIR